MSGIVYRDVKGGVILEVKGSWFYLVVNDVTLDRRCLLPWLNWIGISIGPGDEGKVASALSFGRYAGLIGDKDEN